MKTTFMLCKTVISVNKKYFLADSIDGEKFKPNAGNKATKFSWRQEKSHERIQSPRRASQTETSLPCVILTGNAKTAPKMEELKIYVFA